MTVRAKNMIGRAKRTTRQSESTVSAGFVKALFDLAVRKGADRTHLLSRAALRSDEIEDPDSRIPLPKYAALMRAGQELSGNPALALHFGEAYDISELSIIGLLGQGCATVGEALTELNRFSRLAIEVDGPLADRLVTKTDADGIWMIDTRPNPNDFPEITESSFARMMCTSRRLGAPHLIEAVHVTHAAPDYRAEYDRIFKVPVTFESDRNALLLGKDNSWLQLPLAIQPRYVFGVLSERAEALLKKLENSKSCRGRVEAAIMPVLHTGKAGMNETASKLGMSRRTLARRLKEEGTAFEAVLDELRRRLALDYLDGKKVRSTKPPISWASRIRRLFRAPSRGGPAAARRAFAARFDV